MSSRRRMLEFLSLFELPAEFQEVEWIGSSGTQKIETGYNLQQNSKYVFDIEFNSNNDQRWFGIYATGNVFCLAFKNNYIPVRLNSTWYDDYLSTISLNEKHNLVVENNVNNLTKIYCDNVLHKEINAVFSPSSGLQISIFKETMNSGKGLIGKLYSCKIYDNNVLVRNFVPCYRKSDNAIGLFDTINQVFYTNAGTGTFSKGADI